MAEVFISHAEEDAQIADELAAGLEAAGYAVWYYERDSIPGLDYMSQVCGAIEEARAVVLVVSGDSLGSNQVMNEIVYAHESGKYFVPVLVGVSHVEYQKRQPRWRLALGAATSIRVPPQGVGAVLGRLVSGLRALGVEAHGLPSRPEQPPEPEARVPSKAILQAGGDEIANSIGMKLKLIPAGRFLMGSDKGVDDEKPVHEVAISKPFYLGICPVTQAQYERVTKADPSRFKGSNRPVEQVSWNDAVQFRRTLSKLEGREYRLPTEAEWEYACRAGSTTEYCFGDSETELAEYAWFAGNSGGVTHDVGQKKPNAWGFYDMHGNVWEWCEDVWHNSYEGAPADGSAWERGGDEGVRVLRGGSWNYNPGDCRSADRNRNDQWYEWSDFGFRVCLRDF